MDRVEDRMDGGVKQQALHLAGHVRACIVSDQAVLLDLRRSRYLALDLRQWQVLNGSVVPQDAALRRLRPDRQTDVERLGRSLLQQGIFRHSPTAAPRQTAASAPDSSMDVRDAVPCRSIGAGRAARFVAAASWATFTLRLRPLRAAVDQVARRSSRLIGTDTDHPERLRDAVAAFETLRPLMFTARDRCLYDSLALTRFLAGEGLRSQWVIGVKTQPFAAHSWVQAGGVVLNDLHERVRSFKPILVV
jgi:hypothetical protein